MKTLKISAASLVAASLVIFGCTKGTTPVSPRGLNQEGQLTFKLQFPKALAGPVQEVQAMVSHPDFGQLQASSIPQAVPTTTPICCGYSTSDANISLDVPVGPDRHVMVAYHSDSYNTNYYGYTKVDVQAGANPVSLILNPSNSGSVDVGYVGLFYDFDNQTRSFTNVPGQSDVEFVDVYDGNAYHFDVRDVSQLNSAARLFYVGNVPQRGLYGMAPAPAPSSFKGYAWNYPAGDGAKGGTNGYVDYGDVFLVRTTAGNLVWFTPNSIYTIGSPSDSVYFDMAYGCGSNLPTSLTPCP